MWYEEVEQLFLLLDIFVDSVFFVGGKILYI